MRERVEAFSALPCASYYLVCLVNTYFRLSPHATDYIKGNSMLLLLFASKILRNDLITYTELYFKDLLLLPVVDSFSVFKLSADKDTISTPGALLRIKAGVKTVSTGSRLDKDSK